MRVVAHDQGNAHHTRIENSCEQQETWRRDMNQVGTEALADAGALHFGQIKGQRNLAIQRKGKSQSVSDGKGFEFGGQFRGRRLGIHRQNVNVISCFAHELEHFFEAVGITRHVCERCGLDHETNLAWLVTTERGCIVAAGKELAGDCWLSAFDGEG